jgi:hypothetical protein
MNNLVDAISALSDTLDPWPRSFELGDNATQITLGETRAVRSNCYLWAPTTIIKTERLISCSPDNMPPHTQLVPVVPTTARCICFRRTAGVDLHRTV